MCEIKRIGALRGGRRVDCEKMCENLQGRAEAGLRKMCEIKRVGAFKGQAEGGLRKNVRNLRGLGH